MLLIKCQREEVLMVIETIQNTLYSYSVILRYHSVILRYDSVILPYAYL